MQCSGFLRVIGTISWSASSQATTREVPFSLIIPEEQDASSALAAATPAAAGSAALACYRRPLLTRLPLKLTFCPFEALLTVVTFLVYVILHRLFSFSSS